MITTKVNKSSADCAIWNETHKQEIEHGIVLAQEPTPEELAREKRVEEAKQKNLTERNKIKLLIIEAVRKSHYANEINNVDKRLTEWVEKDYSNIIVLHGVNVRLEKFTQYSSDSWHSHGYYYRLEISGEMLPMGRFDRYRRQERSSFAKLNDKMTAVKLAEWLNEKVGYKVQRELSRKQAAEATQSEEQRKTIAMKLNEVAFQTLGVKAITLGHADQDGKIGAQVSFMLTPTQWSKLAEFTKTLSEV